MEEELIKIDPHVHSSGISLCSQVTIEQIIDEKRKLGYDGMIVANHCQAHYCRPEEHREFMERVIKEYQRGKAYGDELGFKVWLGLEVSVQHPGYSDWLLYGVTEEFLLAAPCLYNLTQKELFELCEEGNVLLVQAHPFRQAPRDVRYMHGVEINCTGGDLEKWEEVIAFAKQNALAVTCGTDYHNVARTFRGGMFVPKVLNSAVEFANYLRTVKKTSLFLEEKTLEIPAENL